MDFELTEEHNLIRDMVRSYAETELAPELKERDEQERFDRELMYDKLGELGLTGIVFPEEYHGGGADYISYAIAVEELSRVCASTGGDPGGASFPLRQPDLHLRHRGAEAEIPDPPGRREQIRCLRLDRTECRVGCWWHQNQRGS